MLEKSRLVLIKLKDVRSCKLKYVERSYLEGEGRETDDNGCREEEGLDDDTLVKESDQDSHGVGLHHSEGSQKDQVDGSFFPLDVKSDEETNG